MKRFEASNQSKGFTPAEALEALKRTLKFADWPLREQRFVPGFSPATAKLSFLAEYTLEHETLLPVISTWVGRNYFYRRPDSRSAVALTVIVGQQSAKDVAEALLLQIVYSQMWSEPRVELSGRLGDVAIYRHPGANQSVAFVRNNVAVSIDNYSSSGKQPDLQGLASGIDNELKEASTVESLLDDERVPRTLRFEPQAKVIRTGERTDLEIEVKDNYPPLHFLFQAKHGSYNQDPAQKDRWYFRAGPNKAQAELALTVVNAINLMAESRCYITIE